MNDTATSQPAESLLTSGTGAITTIHLVLILLVALAGIAIIIVGARRKRIRDDAARRVERNAAEAGVVPDPVEQEPAPVPVAVPAPPPPVVMAPPPPPIEEPTPLADEPIAAAAPLDASPATIAEPPALPPVPPSPAGPLPADGPVTQLKGLGPKVAARLADLGVTTVGQIAALDPAAATALDVQLGPFSGRMARDRWIEQARLLAAGDQARFEAVFGRL